MMDRQECSGIQPMGGSQAGSILDHINEKDLNLNKYWVRHALLCYVMCWRTFKQPGPKQLCLGLLAARALASTETAKSAKQRNPQIGADSIS